MWHQKISTKNNNIVLINTDLQSDVFNVHLDVMFFQAHCHPISYPLLTCVPAILASNVLACHNRLCSLVKKLLDLCKFMTKYLKNVMFRKNVAGFNWLMKASSVLPQLIQGSKFSLPFLVRMLLKLVQACVVWFYLLPQEF